MWLTQREQMNINAKGHFVPLTLCEGLVTSPNLGTYCKCFEAELCF